MRTLAILRLLVLGLLASLALAPQALADTDARAGHTDWEDWSLDWEVSSLFDGVSLQNVSYKGTPILSRASHPVMRVYYDSSCGPYSDRIGGTIYPIPWANNRTVAHRTYTRADGSEWLEIGIYDRLGAYKIYQAWYLSSDGILDAHMFSSGLQCNINHRHYPYWRMDFDLDGAAGDRIQRRSGNSWVTQTTEFDAVASSEYRVFDAASGTSVKVLSGPGDWSIPGQATQPNTTLTDHAIFGRRASNVPVGNYRSMYGTGIEGQERPTSTNASINGADVAVIYRARMGHLSAEGSTLWHSAGPRFIVDVPPDNGAPNAVASANTTSGQAPLGVSFSSAGSGDPDGDTISYAWSFGDGQSSSQANPTHTYTAAGNYDATLTVSDGNGGSDTSTVSIVVDPPNRLPIARATANPASGTAPLAVSFSGSGSTDPDGDSLSYAWDFTSNGSVDATGASATHTYLGAGTYIATLTVSDGNGGVDTDTVALSVDAPNRPPTARATANPAGGTAPLAVSFSGSGSTDLDGDSLSYAWDFTSNGSTDATGVSASHTYLSAGAYTATLTVSDGNGGTDTDTVAVTVSPAGPVAWEYFHGTWDELPDFDALTPISSGAGSNFSLAPRTREDFYGFRFRSCLTAPASGTYTFSTTSDDGSRLRLGGLAVVDNDGLHGPVSASGQIALIAGQSYALEVAFFEKSGGALLDVNWSGPGVSGAIPASVLSPASGCVASPPPPAPVAWEYFHGSWSALPDFDALAPIDSGSSTGFSLAPRTRNDNYGFRFSACVTAPASGSYSFSTTSDDGSSLSVGGLEVVNNDGLHGAETASGQISLSAGQSYPLEVLFFERSGDAVLDVTWSGPGVPAGAIPLSALSAPTTCATAPPPVAPIAWEYFHGTWDQLPNFDLLTPLGIGTAPSFSLAPRTRDDEYGFRFATCLTAPASGTYTFSTTSDDGSALQIGGIPVVNNDGLHAALTRSGQIVLNAGQTYPLEVTFFEKSGGATLDVTWSGPGAPAGAIPVSVLSAPGGCTTAPPPAAPVAWDYYQGSWDQLPAFASLTPTASGSGTGFSLAPRRRDDDYAFRFAACLSAPATGTWTFTTTSDDGSALKVGTTTVVDNDGLHSAQTESGQIALVSGQSYPLEVTFFEKSGDATLDVTWAGPGAAAGAIPLSALSAPSGC